MRRISEIIIFHNFVLQHPEQAYIPDVPSFAPIWGQDAPSQMVAYPELIAGFPCGELCNIKLAEFDVINK